MFPRRFNKMEPEVQDLGLDLEEEVNVASIPEPSSGSGPSRVGPLTIVADVAMDNVPAGASSARPALRKPVGKLALKRKPNADTGTMLSSTTLSSASLPASAASNVYDSTSGISTTFGPAREIPRAQVHQAWLQDSGAPNTLAGHWASPNQQGFLVNSDFSGFGSEMAMNTTGEFPRADTEKVMDRSDGRPTGKDGRYGVPEDKDPDCFISAHTKARLASGRKIHEERAKECAQDLADIKSKIFKQGGEIAEWLRQRRDEPLPSVVDVQKCAVKGHQDKLREMRELKMQGEHDKALAKELQNRFEVYVLGLENTHRVENERLRTEYQSNFNEKVKKLQSEQKKSMNKFQDKCRDEFEQILQQRVAEGIQAALNKAPQLNYDPQRAIEEAMGEFRANALQEWQEATALMQNSHTKALNTALDTQAQKHDLAISQAGIAHRAALAVQKQKFDNALKQAEGNHEKALAAEKRRSDFPWSKDATSSATAQAPPAVPTQDGASSEEYQVAVSLRKAEQRVSELEQQLIGHPILGEASRKTIVPPNAFKQSQSSEIESLRNQARTTERLRSDEKNISDDKILDLEIELRDLKRDLKRMKDFGPLAEDLGAQLKKKNAELEGLKAKMERGLEQHEAVVKGLKMKIEKMKFWACTPLPGSFPVSEIDVLLSSQENNGTQPEQDRQEHSDAASRNGWLSYIFTRVATNTTDERSDSNKSGLLFQENQKLHAKMVDLTSMNEEICERWRKSQEEILTLKELEAKTQHLLDDNRSALRKLIAKNRKPWWRQRDEDEAKLKQSIAKDSATALEELEADQSQKATAIQANSVQAEAVQAQVEMPDSGRMANIEVDRIAIESSNTIRETHGNLPKLNCKFLKDAILESLKGWVVSVNVNDQARGKNILAEETIGEPEGEMIKVAVVVEVTVEEEDEPIQADFVDNMTIDVPADGAAVQDSTNDRVNSRFNSYEFTPADLPAEGDEEFMKFIIAQNIEIEDRIKVEQLNQSTHIVEVGGKENIWEETQVAKTGNVPETQNIKKSNTRRPKNSRSKLNNKRRANKKNEKREEEADVPEVQENQESETAADTTPHSRHSSGRKIFSLILAGVLVALVFMTTSHLINSAWLESPMTLLLSPFQTDVPILKPVVIIEGLTSLTLSNTPTELNNMISCFPSDESIHIFAETMEELDEGLAEPFSSNVQFARACGWFVNGLKLAWIIGGILKS